MYGSSKKSCLVEVGEIVTSPNGSPTVTEKPKTPDGERIVLEESHLTGKEVDNLKQRLKITEDTKLEALCELEKANKVLQELKTEFLSVIESKQAALEAIEASKARAKQLKESKSTTQSPAEIPWEQNVENEIQQYKAAANELNSAKYELTKLRWDFDAATEAKVAAFQEAEDAKHAANINRGKLTTLTMEIGTLPGALAQIKHAASQSREDHSRIMAEKDTHLQAKRNAKEEVEQKILSLKKSYVEQDPEIVEKLQEMLDETNEAILVLKDQLNTMRDSDLGSLRIATLEIDGANKMLEQVLREKNWLGSLVESLKVELEQVKRDNKELKENVTDSALLSEKLEVELVSSIEEEEAILAGETKQEDLAGSIGLRIQELSLEAENARKEAKELDKMKEALNQEVQNFTAIAKSSEENFIGTMKETEEANTTTKLANAQFLNQNLSPSSSSNIDFSGGGELVGKSGTIRLTVEEFETLKGKANRAISSAEREVAHDMAEVEEINKRERVAREMSNEILKEIEHMKASTNQSLKQADMAEAAKRAVEAELLLHQSSSSCPSSPSVEDIWINEH